jgi:TolB protein
MFKKLLSFCFALVMLVLPVHAELKVDIVAGGIKPTSIAVQKFEMSGDVNSKDAAMMRDVVENDLKRTGLFRIVNRDAFPEFVKMGKMPNFKSWAAIKTQVLVQAKVFKEPDDMYRLEFYVWDVDGTEQIEAQSLVASRKSARRLAHIMADAIYERLTGEIGYFDTQIVFIAETGPVKIV